MDEMVAHLKENYARKTDEELIYLMVAYDLTEVARRVLGEEISRREIAEQTINNARYAHEAETKKKQDLYSNPAGRGRRLVAKLIDFIGISMLTGAWVFLGYLYMPESLSAVIDRMSLSIWLGYLFFKDGINGQSFGKRLLKIKVIDTDSGLPCSPSKSFFRNLLIGINVLDWIFIFGKNRQRLGDVLAHTLVVNVGDAESKPSKI